MISNDEQRVCVQYHNVLSGAVGTEHGITDKQLSDIEPRVCAALEELACMRQQGQTAYRELPYREDIVEKVLAMTDRYKERTENLVVLGIGGSALGNIALQTALNDPYYNLLPSDRRPGPRLFVVDNVDPVQVASLLELLDGELDATTFNVISKSGETAETASQFLTIRNLLRTRYGEQGLRDHVMVTTDPTSGTMRSIADADGYDTLEVPDGVGGRWSVLSAVGLFSAAMCGIDIPGLMAGAAAMDDRVKTATMRDNPAAIMAAVHNLMYTSMGKPIAVMMPYSYQLKDLSDWYRQLWAESLGKNKDLDGNDVAVGSTPVKALGTTDQHSQVQLYREGPNDKVFTFLEVESFGRDVDIPNELPDNDSLSYLGNQKFSRLLNAEKAATEYALVASQRPCMTVTFPTISAYTVGQFIYLFEVTTSLMGLLLNVNAYDQPAVQLGKEGTFALMGRSGYDELKDAIDKVTGGAGTHRA